MVQDIRAGAASSAPANLTALGDYLFFTADNGANGRELWMRDPWGNVTMVKNINGNGGSSPNYLTVV